MAGNHIPNDWVGGYKVVQMTVPNSPMFRAHIKGAIAWLADPADWDVDTSETGLPPLSDTVDRTVADGDDDAQQRQDGGGFNRTSASVMMDDGFTPNTRLIGGFRFLNVTIPNSATIDDAEITISCVGASRDDPDVNLHCEAIDTSPSFLTDPNVLSRVRTTGLAVWDAIGIGVLPVASPDIAVPIQEVINRPGWASGNDLTVLMMARGLYDRDFRVESYDGDPPLAAALHIGYSVPAGDTSPEWAAGHYAEVLDSIVTI